MYLFSILGVLLGAVGGVSGIYALVRLVPKIVDRAQLFSENAVLKDQIIDLKRNLGTLQAIAESSRMAIDQLKADLALSMRYIASMMHWIRDGKPAYPPTPPNDLLRLIDSAPQEDEGL